MTRQGSPVLGDRTSHGHNIHDDVDVDDDMDEDGMDPMIGTSANTGEPKGRWFGVHRPLTMWGEGVAPNRSDNVTICDLEQVCQHQECLEIALQPLTLSPCTSHKSWLPVSVLAETVKNLL